LAHHRERTAGDRRVIAPSDVTAWSAIAPWATPDQVEQDLVLSRLMVDAEAPVA
jgi:hypothetical protein